MVLDNEALLPVRLYGLAPNLRLAWILSTLIVWHSPL